MAKNAAGSNFKVGQYYHLIVKVGPIGSEEDTRSFVQY